MNPAPSRPKVSIVIPVYNGSNYLREAIDSALAQTYDNVEILVVNDGSDDEGKTEEIALSYGDKIRYFYKKNGGVSTALNLGIEKMEGYFFSWLSHDDAYYPEKIERQLKFLDGRDDLIVYTDVEFINSRTESTRILRFDHPDSSKFLYYLMTSGPHGCSLLIPRKCFDEVGLFEEEYRMTQDYRMWFRLAKKYELKHMPEVLIKFRVFENKHGKEFNELAKKENDDLYVWCLENITWPEVITLASASTGLFYSELALRFLQRHLLDAADLAFRLSLRNIFSNSWESGPRHIYENLLYVKRKYFRWL